MAAVILTRRGLLRHPAFALDETSGPARVAGPQVPHEVHAAQAVPDAAAPLASLLEQVEKIGKNFYRAAAQQEALARDVAEMRAHFRAAGMEPAPSFVVEKLLPLIDALHRLVEVLAQHEDVGLAEGARLVAARGDACLADLGIEPIPATGERFDPRWHQALEVRPAPPESEGRVIEVVVRGYRRGSKILRPAQVIVGKREDKWTE